MIILPPRVGSPKRFLEYFPYKTLPDPARNRRLRDTLAVILQRRAACSIRGSRTRDSELKAGARKKPRVLPMRKMNMVTRARRAKFCFFIALTRICTRDRPKQAQPEDCRTVRRRRARRARTAPGARGSSLYEVDT
jgi:hypothetical protein